MTAPTRRRLADAVLTAAAAHWPLLLLLELGLVLRGFVVWAYTPAFWFPDTTDYLAAAELGEPLVHRPYGYSAFLALLDGVVPFAGVAVVQHVLGLVAAVLVYAVLLRRGVRRRWATLAVAPLVLDGYVLALEHYVLAESLFMLQLAAGVALLLWRERPGWALAGAAGLVLGAAAVTRNVGSFVVAAVGAWLLVRLLLRTVRWTAVVAFGTVAATVVLSYFAWFSSVHGVFSNNDYDGFFLYGRVSTFVECDEFDVPERLRGLCPDEPVEDRPHPDYYVWNPASPAYSGTWTEDDLGEFARLAIRAHTRDYLRTTLRSAVLYFQPGRTVGEKDVCPEYWEFPTDVDRVAGCTADLATQGFGGDRVHAQLRPQPAAALRAYQLVVHVSGPVLLAMVVGTVWAALRRVPTWRGRVDPLALLAVGAVLIVVPSATAVFDYRYGLPVLVVVPAALALALRGGRDDDPDVDVPDDASSLLVAS